MRTIGMIKRPELEGVQELCWVDGKVELIEMGEKDLEPVDNRKRGKVCQ